MQKRFITHTQKSKRGGIIAFYNLTAYWSPRTVNDVIQDIEYGIYSYFARWPDNQISEIKVIKASKGKYLRTDLDSTDRNNLEDLPVFNGQD